MGMYFRHARSTARALSRSQRAVKPRQLRAVQRLVGRQFEIAHDGIGSSTSTRAATKPSLWLEIFRLALAHGCAVSEQALDCIEQNVDRCIGRKTSLVTEAERQQLRNLFYPRPGLYVRLSEMHDCGLLNRILPEFGGIHGRVIRDFYHRYTVDEHTLLTIRGLEGLWNPPGASRKRFGTILREIRIAGAPHPRADLARRRQGAGRRSRAGERATRGQSVLDRLDLPEDARHTVEFLVRNHLEMSKSPSVAISTIHRSSSASPTSWGRKSCSRCCA